MAIEEKHLDYLLETVSGIYASLAHKEDFEAYTSMFPEVDWTGDFMDAIKASANTPEKKEKYITSLIDTIVERKMEDQ